MKQSSLTTVAAKAVARTAAKRAVRGTLGSSSLVSKLMQTVVSFGITLATKKL